METTILVADFLRACEARALAPKTLSEYRRWLERFAKRFPETAPTVFAEQVEIASASLRRQCYAGATIRQFQCVCSAFARAVLAYDDEAAGLLIRAKAVRPALACPDVEQVAVFVRALSGAYRLQALLMYECGLRISEVLNLTLGDVDREGRYLNVAVSKGAKGRRVPVPPELVPTLKAQFRYASDLAIADQRNGVVIPPANAFEAKKHPRGRSDLYLFPLFAQSSLVFLGQDMPRGRVAVHPSRVERVFAEARRRAGLTVKITPHRLRDAYAVHSLIAGVPVTVIQARLGHASLETTAKYLSYLVSDEGLKAFPALSLFRGRKAASE